MPHELMPLPPHKHKQISRNVPTCTFLHDWAFSDVSYTSRPFRPQCLCSGSLVDEAALFQFEVEELLERVGALAVLAVRWVVLPAVGDHSLQVGDEQLLSHVVAVLQPLCHGLQV